MSPPTTGMGRAGHTENEAVRRGMRDGYKYNKDANNEWQHLKWEEGWGVWMQCL